MTGLIVLAILVAAVAGALAWRRAHPSRALPPARGAARREVTLFNLEVGDVVEHGGVTYIVESRLDYDAQGWRWTEHLLVTGASSEGDRWLSVEEDDRVEVTLLERVRGLDAWPARSDPPDELTWRGRRYTVEERGQARVTRRTRAGASETHDVAYWDYRGPDDAVLCIEDWGNEREITAGRTLQPASLLLLPGDGRPLLGDGSS